MTITGDHEAAVAAPRSEQDRKICEVASMMVGSCAELVPRQVTGHVFKFAKKLVTTLVEVHEERVSALKVDREPASRVAPIAELAQTGDDLTVDAGVQAFLEKFSRETVSGITEYVHKGKEFATEVTSYTLQMGELAVEVLRMRPGHDQEEPISYTLSTFSAAPEA